MKFGSNLRHTKQQQKIGESETLTQSPILA